MTRRAAPSAVLLAAAVAVLEGASFGGCCCGSSCRPCEEPRAASHAGPADVRDRLAQGDLEGAYAMLVRLLAESPDAEGVEAALSEAMDAYEVRAQPLRVRLSTLDSDSAGLFARLREAEHDEMDGSGHLIDLQNYGERSKRLNGTNIDAEIEATKGRLADTRKRVRDLRQEQTRVTAERDAARSELAALLDRELDLRWRWYRHAMRLEAPKAR